MSSYDIERDSLQIIVGRQLSSVEFVQDYLQLRFDGPCLTVLASLAVHVEDDEFRWGDPEFRNEICGRITANVETAEITLEQGIVLKFSDMTSIRISLAADPSIHEAVLFSRDISIDWVLYAAD